MHEIRLFRLNTVAPEARIVRAIKRASRGLIEAGDLLLFPLKISL